MRIPDGTEINGDERDEKEKSPTAEFVLDLDKREEQLIARIFKLSQLLSENQLDNAQEEQIKLILEDALAELDLINKWLYPSTKSNKNKSRHLFH